MDLHFRREASVGLLVILGLVAFVLVSLLDKPTPETVMQRWLQRVAPKDAPSTPEASTTVTITKAAAS